MNKEKSYLKKQEVFQSWIPTVTGSLSFSAIGFTDWPRGCLCKNDITNSGRGIFIQTRYCNDFLLPFLGWNDRVKDYFFSKFSRGSLGPISGKHHFVLIISDKEVDEFGDEWKLFGKAYALTGTSYGDKAITKALNKITQLDADHLLSEEDLEESEKLLSYLSPLVCSVELNRNGEVKLISQKLNNVPEVGVIDSDFIFTFAEQLFFFIRDIVHNHQHHEGNNDTIISLYKEEENWKKQVYFDLYRKAISYKRIRSEYHITNAPGILAYAGSFLNTFKDDAGLPEFDVKNTLLSLESAKSELSQKSAHKSVTINTIQTAIFGITALIFSLTTLTNFSDSAREKVIPAQFLTELTSKIAAYPIQSIFVVIFICFLMISFLGLHGPNSQGYIKDTQRILQYYKKRKSVGIQFLTFLVFGFLAVKLFLLSL